MRFLIDMLTPKQCLFLARLSERLGTQGHQVLRTTREYRETLGLLRLKGIDATIVGRHGGDSLPEKLRASAERTIAVGRLIEGFKPDIVVSFSSPEAARAAFGLGLPHVSVNDSPHAEAVARLTVPLSRMLFTPRAVGKKAWVPYGISAEAVVEYNALDPIAWLKGFRPDPRVPQGLGLDLEKPVVVLRPEEAFAAYLLRENTRRSMVETLAKSLLEREPRVQVVLVPRYTEQLEAFSRYRSLGLVVANSVLDGASLLYHSSVFVGAGGTMTAEACLLGVPSLSCYPGEPYLVEKFLMRRGLLVRAERVDEALRFVRRVLADPQIARKNQSRKARRLFRKMEDPIEVIADGLTSPANGQPMNA